MRKTSVEQISVEHPLESFFDIEECSTTLDVVKTSSELVDVATYDDKDKEIEQQLTEVYDLALDGYDAQVRDMENIDPKYRARSNEVAIQYLNTALSSVNSKMTLKRHKDGISSKIVKTTNIQNNNVVVTDRNDILDMLKNANRV